MTRTVYYAATTLDGFLADENDSLDWLLKQQIDKDGPFSYDDFIAGIGAITMGRTTYDWVLDHEGGRWPYRLPCRVFSHRELRSVDGDVTFVRGDVSTVHEDLVHAADGKDVWVVGGGDLAGQFADAGLLDEVAVSIAPVVLGAGRPLLPRRLDLRVTEVGRNGAFACARYDVVGPLADSS
ncbi:MAG TPA: dihydrofolate reductase family protein [Intrasporangium sp.]|uniref:dihydrofolate reductase family protein n=1 Tax=Intrasporangium sp. TaxID=1925024 RepID=UPI002B46C005|nr:dihydrofolate reductase family protein [Intrasporangium sp.]HKX65659.1 dihydrofolate reductase family protein [Intrasporangium sp.]